MDTDEEHTPPRRPTPGVSPKPEALPARWLSTFPHEYGMLGNSRERAELCAHGVEELDSSLIATMNAKVRRRPSKEEMRQLGLLKTPVVAASESLARRSLSKQLEASIERRPSRELLVAKGIIQTPTAVKATVNPMPEEFEDSCGDVKPEWQGNWPAWLFKVGLDPLDNALRRRPSAESLSSRGILKTATEAKTQLTEREWSSFSLLLALRDRPDIGELVDRGIVPPLGGLDPVMLSKLDAMIRRRPSAAELLERGLLKNAVAATREGLQRRSRSNSLCDALTKRPSLDAIVDAGIYVKEHDDDRAIRQMWEVPFVFNPYDDEGLYF